MRCESDLWIHIYLTTGYTRPCRLNHLSHLARQSSPLTRSTQRKISNGWSQQHLGGARQQGVSQHKGGRMPNFKKLNTNNQLRVFSENHTPHASLYAVTCLTRYPTRKHPNSVRSTLILDTQRASL